MYSGQQIITYPIMHKMLFMKHAVVIYKIMHDWNGIFINSFLLFAFLVILFNTIWALIVYSCTYGCRYMCMHDGYFCGDTTHSNTTYFICEGPYPLQLISLSVNMSATECDILAYYMILCSMLSWAIRLTRGTRRQVVAAPHPNMHITGTIGGLRYCRQLNIQST